MSSENLFIFNKHLYDLAKELMDSIPKNINSDNQKKVLIILLLKGLEILKAVEILVKEGYPAQAASLVANSIEIMLQVYKVRDIPSAADEEYRSIAVYWQTPSPIQRSHTLPYAHSLLFF